MNENYQKTKRTIIFDYVLIEFVYKLIFGNHTAYSDLLDNIINKFRQIKIHCSNLFTDFVVLNRWNEKSVSTLLLTCLRCCAAT